MKGQKPTWRVPPPDKGLEYHTTHRQPENFIEFLLPIDAYGLIVSYDVHKELIRFAYNRASTPFWLSLRVPIEGRYLLSGELIDFRASFAEKVQDKLFSSWDQGKFDLKTVRYHSVTRKLMLPTDRNARELERIVKETLEEMGLSWIDFDVDIVILTFSEGSQSGSAVA